MTMRGKNSWSASSSSASSVTISLLRRLCAGGGIGRLATKKPRRVAGVKGVACLKREERRQRDCHRKAYARVVLSSQCGGLDAMRPMCHIRCNMAAGTYFRSKMMEFEKSLLIKLLTETRGNIRQAAFRVDERRRTIYRMMKRHGINPREFKELR